MRTILSLFILLFSFNAFSQELSAKQFAKFQKMEAALVPLVNNFQNDSLSFEERAASIHDFIPRFVTALKEKNSYLYPFDSLLFISKIKAPDNAFKVFTWELKEPLETHRYYGAIQFNSEDLKMKPLFDYSDTMDYHTQMVLTPENWYGAIYYNCVLTENKKGDKFYTLFGLDKADFVSTRKVLEVVTIDNNNEVIFGKEPFIEYYDSTGRLFKKQNRMFLEFYDKATLSLNYNTEKELIIYDHVTPPSEKEKDAEFSYIPDGTYEGLIWKKDKWVWVSRVFKYSIDKPDSPPMPAPQNTGGKKNILGQ